jgi:hypothetical protein
MAPRNLIFAALVIFAPSNALAQWGPENVTYSPMPGPDAVVQINLQHSRQLEAFRAEGLSLQRSDGGTLTSAHRAKLQAELDQIEAGYRRNLHRYDAWSVNSMGQRQ